MVLLKSTDLPGMLCLVKALGIGLGQVVLLHPRWPSWPRREVYLMASVRSIACSPAGQGEQECEEGRVLESLQMTPWAVAINRGLVFACQTQMADPGLLSASPCRRRNPSLFQRVADGSPALFHLPLCLHSYQIFHCILKFGFFFSSFIFPFPFNLLMVRKQVKLGAS